MQAKELRIGERFYGHWAYKEPPTITALHELCPSRPTPHVHVVTTKGQHCRDFDAPV